MSRPAARPVLVAVARGVEGEDAFQTGLRSFHVTEQEQSVALVPAAQGRGHRNDPEQPVPGGPDPVGIVKSLAGQPSPFGLIAGRLRLGEQAADEQGPCHQRHRGGRAVPIDPGLDFLLAEPHRFSQIGSGASLAVSGGEVRPGQAGQIGAGTLRAHVPPAGIEQSLHDLLRCVLGVDPGIEGLLPQVAQPRIARHDDRREEGREASPEVSSLPGGQVEAAQAHRRPGQMEDGRMADGYAVRPPARSQGRKAGPAPVGGLSSPSQQLGGILGGLLPVGGPPALQDTEGLGHAVQFRSCLGGISSSGLIHPRRVRHRDAHRPGSRPGSAAGSRVMLASREPRPLMSACRPSACSWVSTSSPARRCSSWSASSASA